ncbi:translation initiation factor IF-2-like [Chelonia mydas]|uniref:translation initiation factor IF-2-like n=1 Tax=Chelonia mydas TaxID=8469 RepID=UPI001CA8DCD5|nr:translation initiation factor IF-2-like [Chelonia mydas]
MGRIMKNPPTQQPEDSGRGIREKAPSSFQEKTGCCAGNQHGAGAAHVSRSRSKRLALAPGARTRTCTRKRREGEAEPRRTRKSCPAAPDPSCRDSNGAREPPPPRAGHVGICPSVCPPSRAPNSASSGSPLSLVWRPHLAPAISRARSPPAEEPLPLLVLSVPRTRQRRGQRQRRLHTAPAPPLSAAAPSASFPSPRCSGDPLPAAPPAGSWGRRPAAAHARGVRIGAAPRSGTRRRVTVLPEWREGDGLWLGASRPCPRGRDGRRARGRVSQAPGWGLTWALRGADDGSARCEGWGRAGPCHRREDPASQTVPPWTAQTAVAKTPCAWTPPRPWTEQPCQLHPKLPAEQPLQQRHPPPQAP